MCRQKLLVQGVAQDIGLVLLSLPVGRVIAVAISLISGAVLEVIIVVIRRGGWAGLTLGGEPVVVEGGGVEPRGGGWGRWGFVVGGEVVIGEEGAEDGGGGGVVVGVVEGHFLG